MSEESIGGLVLVALMFICAGIGLLFGRADVGGTIGLGLGFLAMAYFRVRKPKIESEKSITVTGTIGAVLLALIGLAFMVSGIALLLQIPLLTRYVGGLIVVAIGLVFFAAALKIIKK